MTPDKSKSAYLATMGELPAPPPANFAGQWSYGQRGGLKRSPAAAHYLATAQPGSPAPSKFNPLPRKKKTPAKPNPQRTPKVTQPLVIDRPGLRLTIAA